MCTRDGLFQQWITSFFIRKWGTGDECLGHWEQSSIGEEIHDFPPHLGSGRNNPRKGKSKPYSTKRQARRPSHSPHRGRRAPY
uniref:Uncharacterized protein n=1 Tax=Picea glauca TaxID=3330 RepID=A0A101LVP4_PICGL|nr:hypothetical protein ABT39_MTgene1992 [Picea glauca]QHR87476.1 hypothetical protein Q903MT_gene1487 [Picea sitchensis]